MTLSPSVTNITYIRLNKRQFCVSKNERESTKSVLKRLESSSISKNCTQTSWIGFEKCEIGRRKDKGQRTKNQTRKRVWTKICIPHFVCGSIFKGAPTLKKIDKTNNSAILLYIFEIGNVGASYNGSAFYPLEGLSAFLFNEKLITTNDS